MSLDSKVILAELHTPEYLLHKYWARKPHNIIAQFISELVPENGWVLDPFCGSGVVLNEAKKKRINAIGIDLNPIAILNSKVITNPPDIEKFDDVVKDIISNVENKISNSYSTKEKKQIRYLIHAVKTECKNCEKTISNKNAKKIGSKYICPVCQSELKFNLENMIGSEVIGCCVEGEKNVISDEDICLWQSELSNSKIFDIDESTYNYVFVENRRILAYKGMQTKDLFTPRNYNILCYIASEFEKIEDEKVRDAAFLLLTASVAQCSRLIPSRNNLSTGGPAWSVPGFWVPAQHLETNPIVHINARIKKFEKGLRELNKVKNLCEIKILEGNSIVEMPKLEQKVDMIFFDPPYGDNVPYTEFSTMWNSFLKKQPKYEEDVSVSDRTSRIIAWEKYHNEINQILQKCSTIIKQQGHLLVTFNNNDLKAWRALIGGLQDNGFVCDYVSYIIPAVVSSKAQFSPKGSYITDIYSVYSYNPEKKPTQSLQAVTDALIRCATVRENGIAKNLVYRTIMIEWIKNNIDSRLLENISEIVDSLFFKEGDMMYYKGDKKETFSIIELVKESAKRILNDGPCEWKTLYKLIAEEYIEYGFFDASELREYLSESLVIINNKCISYKE